MSAEARLQELGITLPTVGAPLGSYVHYVRTGNLLFLSGKGPQNQGKVGGDVTLEQANQDARDVGLQLLAVMRDAMGSLDKVTQVVKVLGMVNAVPDFGQQPSGDQWLL